MHIQILNSSHAGSLSRLGVKSPLFLAHWSHPLRDFMKINCDGAFHNLNKMEA